jgi:hypothetical protein
LTGWTYFIQAGGWSAPIKIGSTRVDPEARRRALQAGSPVPLELVGTMQGVHHERKLHERFADWRLTGEWFDADAPGLREVAYGDDPS